MNRRALLGAMCSLVVPALSQPASAGTGDAALDALLTKYVRPNADGVNRIDYARWKASARDLSRLNGYIGELAARAPSRMPRDEAFAFWCNLYNAITLSVVLDRYPVASIRDIKSDGLFDPKAYTGPWRTKRVTIEGRSYSLDDIEHEVLRPVFKDPRVHYAVNCAAHGCPNLRAKAWTAVTLDADLDGAAREFINHSRAVTALPGNRLRVSSIYKWYGGDFGGSDEAILAHLRKYAGTSLAAVLASRPAIAEYGYDWSLNDLPSSIRTQSQDVSRAAGAPRAGHCAALVDQQSRLEPLRQALSHLSNATTTATTAPSAKSIMSVPNHMPQSCITSAWAGLDEPSIQSKAAGPMFVISHRS